jgi:hypothetical protein
MKGDRSIFPEMGTDLFFGDVFGEARSSRLSFWCDRSPAFGRTQPVQLVRRLNVVRWILKA